MTGVVVRGLQQGRTLGYPTINISYEGTLDVPSGVYAARVELSDGMFCGAAVVGGDFVESATPKLEVHLLGDTKPERYGEVVQIELMKQVSELQRIADLDKLREKIAVDVAIVKSICLPE